jgi:hypothetical protein
MDIEQEIETIKQRNLRVEADKAWEVSWARRIFIAVGTYIVAGIWLVLIEDSNPWLKSFVPAIGYLLSTLSLPFIKSWWVNTYGK